MIQAIAVSFSQALTIDEQFFIFVLQSLQLALDEIQIVLRLPVAARKILIFLTLYRILSLQLCHLTNLSRVRSVVLRFVMAARIYLRGDE